MKILHFSTDDIAGGAAKGTYRLHVALRDAGHISQIIVRNKQSDDKDVQQVPSISSWRSRFRRVKGRLPLLKQKMPTPSYVFNFDLEPEIDTQFFYTFKPGSIDIICLHWITGLLTAKTVRKIYDHYRCPLVWIPGDQEPVTGGCHYSFGCDGFTKQCGNCPQLSPTNLQDRSRVVWRRKYQYLKDLPITFAAPTSWVKARVQESSLFKKNRVELIPLAINTNVFRPFNQHIARDLLNVPEGKKVIFFGSAWLEDPRKGMIYLQDALHQLSSMLADKNSVLSSEEIFLLIAGRNDKNFFESLPFPSRQVGYLRDDVTLALAYQAADVFVCPSTEDAGPMMIAESMLCGTPVVAFNTGGAPDLIETMKTGYLAAYKDSFDLANGIYKLLSANNITAIRAATHEVAVRKHSASIVAERHLELYNLLLNNN